MPTWRAAFEAEHWTLAPTHRACLLHEEMDGKPLHTVIAVVDCPALNRFRDTLAQASGLDLPHTLPHVTLLTSQYGRGIGLSLLADFEARLVRDLAVQQEKQVQLVLDGEETELDRNIVEELGDPLVHMIRNSVDHGIERPEVRSLYEGLDARWNARCMTVPAQHTADSNDSSK